MLGVPTSDPMSGFLDIRRELFQRIAPLLRPLRRDAVSSRRSAAQPHLQPGPIVA